jgi:hypothetical protein
MAWFTLQNTPIVQMSEAIKREAQRREREKDMQEFWPKCLAASYGDLKSARRLFYGHIVSKQAWRSRYWVDSSLRQYVGDLTPEGYKEGSGIPGVDDQL